MTGFKQIESRHDLADYLNIPYSKLTYIIYRKGIESYYKTFEIGFSEVHKTN